MTATTFPTYTAETAPESARSRVERVTAQLGFTPAAVGRMAGSPELLATFLQANGYFERCSLTALQREVVIITVARRHGCHLCLAMHTAALHRLGGDEALIAALRDGTAVTDVQLEALRTFTLTDFAIADEFAVTAPSRRRPSMRCWPPDTSAGTRWMSCWGSASTRCLPTPTDSPRRPWMRLSRHSPEVTGPAGRVAIHAHLPLPASRPASRLPTAT